MGNTELEMKKNFGKVKVKRISPGLEEIPDDCGYEKKFKYDIDMYSNGIMGDCIEWCQKNCKGKWGWWFKGPPGVNQYDHCLLEEVVRSTLFHARFVKVRTCS